MNVKGLLTVMNPPVIINTAALWSFLAFFSPLFWFCSTLNVLVQSCSWLQEAVSHNIKHKQKKTLLQSIQQAKSQIFFSEVETKEAERRFSIELILLRWAQSQLEAIVCQHICHYNIKAT